MIASLLAFTLGSALLLSCLHAAPIHPASPLGVLPSWPAYQTSYDRVRGVPYTVSYDERAIVVNGERVLLLSGSIHYPRFPPGEWAHQLNLTRLSGLNTVQTYVFWNYHEPVRRQYDFESESRNLAQFLQLAADFGLYVYLRIGPFVCSEWTYGGIPLWLREDRRTVFRTNDTSWEYEMTAFVSVVMRYVQPFLARNGGPIILAQIENEYDNMEGNDAGNAAYVQWCGKLAQSYDSGLVWGMCQSHDAPAPLIPTCNGVDCYNFIHPGRKQPALYTEHWSATAWTWKWGSQLPHIPAETMAYTAARWFAAGGCHMNYYMFSGGTTPGRWTGGPLLVNSYDYDSPVTEWGVPRADKFPHLTLLHYVLQAYSSVIINQPMAIDSQQQLTHDVVLMTYGDQLFGLLFFINTADTASVLQYHSHNLTLAAASVLIFDFTTFTLLFDSANVSLSTETLAALHAFPAGLLVTPQPVSGSTPSGAIGYIAEPHGLYAFPAIAASQPLELLTLAQHSSDHVFYQTVVNISSKALSAQVVVLRLEAVTEHFHVFFNSQFVGFGSGAAQLKIDTSGLRADRSYNLTLVVQADGVLNCCGGLEAVNEGILGAVSWDGSDISRGVWLHNVGLQGEQLQLTIKTPPLQASYWASYAVELTGSMGKGQVWINGHHLGRYWNITDESGKRFSQQYNHVPAVWLSEDEGDNTLVLWEEIGGDPAAVRLLQMS